MIQSFETQLQVVLRALGDVIAPALEGAEKHVAEQLGLSIATLSFIQARLPHARRYFRMELKLHLDLAETAAEMASDSAVQSLIASGDALLADPEADVEDYQAMTGQLRNGITAILQAAAGQPHKAPLEAMILEKSEAILLQYRLWCAPFGFELDPAALPPPAWEKT